MSEYDNYLIGLFAESPDREYLITWKELKDSIEIGGYTLINYLDKRKSTCLNYHFKYDPYAGYWIPWRKLRAEAKAIEKGILCLNQKTKS